MPRRARIESGTGIFHVMMRGINHQNIFEDEEDCWQFINTLDRVRMRYNDDGKPCGTNCIYYAYCLMGNHFHLLIRERDEKVGDTIKHGSVEPVFQICGVETVLERITFEDLDALVNEPLSDDIGCMDIEDPSRSRPSWQGAENRTWK